MRSAMKMTRAGVRKPLIRSNAIVGSSSKTVRTFSSHAKHERNYSHSSSSASSSASHKYAALAALAVAATIPIALSEQREAKLSAGGDVDYEQVRKDIAALLDNEKYDDGSYGPVLVRLAWHASGTYDKSSDTGGSDGSTMRFKPEASDGANAGLAVARNLLESVKQKHPNITYADLWILAGVVAIEELGGPKIPFYPGRSDASTEAACPPQGRLPDAAQGAQHIRNVFYRMGFNDQEIVALSGAHAMGRCHTDRSGFDGPWTKAPTMFSNEYYRELLENKWAERKWNGPRQFEDLPRKEIMMLATDMALVSDPEFKKYVEKYAADESLFFKDFSAAFHKLTELGCKNLQKPWYTRYFGL